MDYKKLNYEAIEDWCFANGQEAWLEATINQDIKVAVYPTIVYTDENGKKCRKQDKTAAPTYEMRPINFLQVKEAFVTKFMPEIKPNAAPKKPTMRDRFAQRKAGK